MNLRGNQINSVQGIVTLATAVCVANQIVLPISVRNLKTFIDSQEIVRQNFISTETGFFVSDFETALANVATDTRSKLKAEFQSLVSKWRDETFFHSSLTKVFAHPAYQRIIAMGKDAIPFVLEELQKGQNRWFYALKFMAGEDPAAGIKDFEQAKSMWIEWGYRNNYI